MKEEVRHEIVRRWREGQSMRGIAQDLNAARKTVQRVIQSHQQQREEGLVPPALRPRKKRRSQLDEYEDALRELLTRYPNITVTRLLEELRDRGYRGGYTVLRQRVKQLRPRKSSPFVERFETSPAQQAQMDYAVYDLDFTHEGRRRVNLFGYILGYSRRQYLHFVESQDMQTTLREHVRAFEHLGGVAATCLYDNMKVVVARYEDEEPIYNTRFLAFATHHGYRPVACRPRRPQTKGKIERPFDYVEKNLLNGRTFRSLACLRNYRREDLTAALERATRFGAFSLGAVERILAVQARPKTSYEHLADQTKDHLRELLGDDPTPPRSTAEYQQFLFDEPSPSKEETEEPLDEPTQEENDPPQDGTSKTGEPGDEPPGE